MYYSLNSWPSLCTIRLYFFPHSCARRSTSVASSYNAPSGNGCGSLTTLTFFNQVNPSIAPWPLYLPQPLSRTPPNGKDASSCTVIVFTCTEPQSTCFANSTAAPVSPKIDAERPVGTEFSLDMRSAWVEYGIRVRMGENVSSDQIADDEEGLEMICGEGEVSTLR